MYCHNILDHWVIFKQKAIIKAIFFLNYQKQIASRRINNNHDF